MAPPALRDRVERVFLTALSLEVPGPDADLVEGGLLDSLQFVNLLIALEAEFGVTIALDAVDLEAFRTVDRIAALLEELGAAAAAPRWP